MKKTKLFALPVVTFVTGVFTAPAYAVSLLPGNIQDIFDLFGQDGAGTADFIGSKVATALYFTLGALVLFGVIYSIIAAFKYIRSEGDPGQIEEAQKGIKAIFYGILAMMLGIVGIVLIFVFMGADRPAAELTQTCLSAPGSKGCAFCKEIGLADDPASECGKCEDAYAAAALEGADKVTGSTFPDCVDPLEDGTPWKPEDIE